MCVLGGVGEGGRGGGSRRWKEAVRDSADIPSRRTVCSFTPKSDDFVATGDTLQGSPEMTKARMEDSRGDCTE